MEEKKYEVKNPLNSDHQDEYLETLQKMDKLVEEEKQIESMKVYVALSIKFTQYVYGFTKEEMKKLPLDIRDKLWTPLEVQLNPSIAPQS